MTNAELFKLTSTELAKELSPFNHRMIVTFNEESPWIDEMLHQAWDLITRVGIRKGKYTESWSIGDRDYYYNVYIDYLNEHEYELTFEYQVQDYSSYKK